MSTFLDITRNALGAALAFMESDVVEYKGTTAVCVAQEETTQIMRYGGFRHHFTGFVRVAKTGFPEPVKGELLTLNGTELRIVSVDECPISFKISLEQADK
jgi:hypothetical protein